MGGFDSMAKKKNPQPREDILELAIDDIRSKFGEGSIMRSFQSAGGGYIHWNIAP